MTAGAFSQPEARDARQMLLETGVDEMAHQTRPTFQRPAAVAGVRQVALKSPLAQVFDMVLPERQPVQQGAVNAMKRIGIGALGFVLGDDSRSGKRRRRGRAVEAIAVVFTTVLVVADLRCTVIDPAAQRDVAVGAQAAPIRTAADGTRLARGNGAELPARAGAEGGHGFSIA